MADESFVISVVQGALSRSISLAEDEIRLGFKRDLRKIVRRLRMIQTSLRHAQNRRIESEAMKEWFNKSLNVKICGVENALVELAYESRRTAVEVQNQTTEKVHSCFSLTNSFALRFKMAVKFKYMDFILARISKEAYDYLGPIGIMYNMNSVTMEGSSSLAAAGYPLADLGEVTMEGYSRPAAAGYRLSRAPWLRRAPRLRRVGYSHPAAASYPLLDLGEVRLHLTSEGEDESFESLGLVLEQGHVAGEDEDVAGGTIVYLEAEAVGREEDVNVVIEMLLGSDIEDGPSVIAIVGMGGLGKTTLAQLVYKNEKVVNNFGDERMWVSGFVDFNVKRVLNEMLKSLTGVKSKSHDIQGIVRELREKLEGKRYLLVLDDVWSGSLGKWECLRDSLLEMGGSKGSKIVVTTRSMEVVSGMINFPTLTHQLSPLSPSDSWAMFTKGVFANGGPIETQPLVDIGKRIVEKCNGVPLKIKSIASLLYCRHSEDEWRSIMNNIWSSFENGWVSIKNNEICSSFGNENRILKKLSSTFNQLPLDLKLCFAYSSVFPKGADIKRD